MSETERLTTAERAALAKLLDLLADRLEVAGCNEFELPDTPENLAMAEAAARYADEDDPLPVLGDGKVLVLDDYVMLDYLRHRAGLEATP